MEIIGYIAYATLVLLAVVWTVAVRKDLGAGAQATLRALYFVLASIIVPAFGVNLAHALWLAPFGCLFSRSIVPVLLKIPVVSIPFALAGDAFERIVHVGVPRDRVREAQAAALCDGPNACAGKDESD